PDITSVNLLDAQGTLVSDGGSDLAAFATQVALEASALNTLATGETIVDADGDRLRIKSPVLLGEELIGVVLLDYSLLGIRANIEVLQRSLLETESETFAAVLVNSLAVTALMMLIGALLAVSIARRLKAPIQRLVKFAHRVGSGAFDRKVEVTGSDEIGELAYSLNLMAERLENRSQEIEFLAFHDGLTKLPNRELFKRTLAETIMRAEVQGEQLALLFIDIDNFKLINDVYGHDAGDFILIEISRRIAACLGDYDELSAASGDPARQSVLARLAGDEFVALLHAAGRKIDLARVGRRILQAVGRPFQWERSQVTLGISIGIAIYPADGEDADTLLRHADAAMYHVKEEGKNDFHFFSAEFDRVAHEQLELVDQLPQALRENQIEFWYQPQLDLSRGRIIAAEALIRWRHPERGVLLPGAFMPLVEKTIHSQELARAAIATATAQLAEWKRIAPGLRMSINISPRDLQRHGWALEELENAAGRRGLASSIDLEITETYFLRAEGYAKEVLSQIKEHGYSIWLDDFGTGYSSLNHLKHFPVDGVKVDRSYIADLARHPESLALTAAIVQYTAAVGIDVLAEGVETEEQEIMLRQMGCHLVQGFRYAKALPAAEFEVLLREQALAPAGELRLRS
ncbi:MAG: EAL domain-containing protein, partial [Pseudomonadota bacterium]